MSFARGIATLVAVLTVLAPVRAAVAADTAEQRMVRLEMTIGKAQVVDFKDAFTRVSVTNPNVADVFVVSPKQILVNGKADRKSTRLNSSHSQISYAVFCL